MQDIWEFKDPQYPKYPTEKNLNLLKFIVEASSNEGDLVLDCFAGSGTTLIAAQSLNRNWIGIDQSEPAIKVIQKCLEALPTNLFSAVEYEFLADAAMQRNTLLKRVRPFDKESREWLAIKSVGKEL